MKKNPTVIILIVSIISTLVTVSVLVFFWKIIKNKNEHISVVLSTLEEKMKTKDEALAFAGKVTEIKTLEETINSYFFDSNKVDMFVDYLENIGTELGSSVSVKSIEISKENEDIVEVKLSIAGTFQNVMETIVYLENIPYQVNISHVYLNKDIGQENGAKGEWQADISFSILGSK